ncbi:hypothetical protein MTR_7g017290 [Medicago truncatula]|uniref:Uncharacterized protein n=1 Tax=Medicago truncatula TaxID=3880 RepID=G7KRY9_MEDTR|nr:hypothetical protein MTR_7g017290 [Medicago truncatula]
MTCEATGYIVIAYRLKQNLEKNLQEFCLAVDGAGTSSFYSQMECVDSKASSMNDMLSFFNQMFMETSGIESTWNVFDQQLRKQIITSLQY